MIIEEFSRVQPQIRLISTPLEKVKEPLAVLMTATSEDKNSNPTQTSSPAVESSHAADFALSSLNTEHNKKTAQQFGAQGTKGSVTVLGALENSSAPITLAVGIEKTITSDSLIHVNYREELRQAAGALTRSAKSTENLVIAFNNPTGNLLHQEDDIAAVAEGALLGLYEFNDYKSETNLSALKNIYILTNAEKTISLGQKLNKAEVISSAINTVRDLVNQPPNELYPETFAQLANQLSKQLPLKVTIWDEKKLAKENFGGILAVGQGSVNPPRLVKVEYTPEKPHRSVALVGKGITFDSGGLSLKPPTSMTTMKLDMAGAAVALETVVAAASLNLPVAITAWLCLAENMPSGHAQRPSDIYTSKSGKTVEVLNTDAEGRLVLADGLTMASHQNPDAIIDIATLTGAQTIALGNKMAGIMGNTSLRDSIKSAADEAGEMMWPMPLPEDLKTSLKSTVADISNMGDRFGGMLIAGIFLSEFIGKNDSGSKIPWAHIDIAGPAFNEKKPWGYTPEGGTGIGVRTLINYLETLG